MADPRYRTYRRSALPLTPELGVFAGWSRRDQFYGEPGAITPARLGRLLRAADGGDLSAQAELGEKLEQDGHYFSVLSKRKSACIERPLDITPGDETPLAEEISDFCRVEIDRLDNWDDVLFDLFDAIGKGYSVAQVVWMLEGGRVRIGELDWWDPREFCYHWQAPRVLRVLTDAQPTFGEELAAGQWIVHRHRATSGDLSHSPLQRKICWEYVFKHFPKRDWVIFCEAYGMPRRRGKYPRGASEEDKAVLEQATIDLGTDGAIVIPADMELDFLELKQAGQLPFPALIEHCDATISKVVLGQTMTTDAPDRGARSLGEVQAERSEEPILRRDCKAMARTIRRCLLRPLTVFNYGPSAPVPSCTFRFEEPVDLNALSERDERLASMVPLSAKEIYEVYSRQPPIDETDAVRLPPRSAAAPAASGGGEG